MRKLGLIPKPGAKATEWVWKDTDPGGLQEFAVMDAGLGAAEPLPQGLAAPEAAAPGSITGSTIWIAADGGDWSDGTNWIDSEPPDLSTAATIGAAGSYEVTISTQAAAGSLLIDNPDATVLDDDQLAIGTTLEVSAGTFALEPDGTLVGGTIQTGSAGIFEIDGGTSSGTLTDITYDGTLTVGKYLTLYMTGADFFADGGVINLLGAIDAPSDAVINGATILADGGLVAEDNATLTLGPQTNILGGSFGGGGTVINQGTITAGTHGSTVIDCATFIDPGKIAVSNGDTVLFFPTDYVSGGLGNFTTSSGGVLDLDCPMSNAGATLNLSTGAELTCQGSIAGGTIRDTGGGLIGIGGVLSNVAYHGTLDLTGADSNLALIGTETFSSLTGTGSGVVNLTGPDASLLILGNTALNGATLNIGNEDRITFEGPATGTTYTLTLGNTLNIVQTAAGSGAGIELSDDDLFLSPSTLVNDGTITASAKSGYFNVNGPLSVDRFINQGKIVVSNGETFGLAVNVAGGLGSFSTAAGSAVELASGYTISNTGASFSLGSGARLLLAGTIAGGTIADSGGGLVTQNGLLDGVAYQGTLDVTGAAGTLYLEGANSLSGAGNTGAGKINLTGARAAIYAESITSLNGGTMNIGSADGDSIYCDSASTGSAASLTFGRQFDLVQSAAKSTAFLLFYNDDPTTATIINQGTISAVAKGGQFSIIGDDYNNFSNQGIIDVANGDIFNIEMSLTTAQLGSFTTSAGGLVMLYDTLNNAGATLSLGTGAQLTCLGTITGGTIADTGSGLISDGALLSGVVYRGTLDVETAFSSLTLLGAESFSGIAGVGAGVLNLTGDGVTLVAEGNTTLNGAILDIGNANDADVISGDEADLGTNSTLTLGPQLDVVMSQSHGSANIVLSDVYGTNNGTLINEGTISASASGGGSLAIQGQAGDAFVNRGMISASNGDTISLEVSLTTAQLGSFTTVGGGAVELAGYSGTLNNSGATLHLATGNQLTLGGTLEGGIIDDTGGGLIGSGGTLTGVTCEGSLNLTQAGAYLFVTNGLNVTSGSSPETINVTGDSALLTFYGNEIVNHCQISLGNNTASAEMLFENEGTPQTLTLGNALSINEAGNALIDYDGYGNGNFLINNGTITAGLAAGSHGIKLTIEGGATSDRFTNAGTLAATNGGILDLSGAERLSNFSGTTLTGGTYEASAGSTLLMVNGEKIVTDAATIVLTGAGSAIEAKLGSTSTETTLDQTLLNIASTGTLKLLSSRNFTASAAFTDSGYLSLGGGTFTSSGGVAVSATGKLVGTGTLAAALTGTGTLSASSGGVLDLSGGGSFAGTLTGAGVMTIAAAMTLDAGASISAAAELVAAANITLASVSLTNTATDQFIFHASSGDTLTLGSTGTGAFTNLGTLKLDETGTVLVSAPFTNSGTVAVDSGTFAFLGSVAGTGTMDLASAGTVLLQLGASGGQAVDFLATTGLLDLSQPIDFAGTISGFGGSDKIDLIDTVETAYNYVDNVLTVKDGSSIVARLYFTGSSNSFSLGTDMHDGTLITFG